jgi:hypothetical protein
MDQPEKRDETRVTAGFPGVLFHGETAAPCVIQNMCSRGFLIKHREGLPVGQVVRLKCELYPAQSVECTVQVRYVNADCLGARVIEIGDDSRTLCQRYLEEQRAAGGQAGRR